MFLLYNNVCTCGKYSAIPYIYFPCVHSLGESGTESDFYMSIKTIAYAWSTSSKMLQPSIF